jgi:Gram-negative bacterial TonB protein C-terminal
VLYDLKTSLITFRARPAASFMARPRTILAGRPGVRQPGLLVNWAEGRNNWRSSLRIILTKVYLEPFRLSSDLFRETPVMPFRFAGRPLSVSLLVHSAAILILAALVAYSRSMDVSAYASYDEPKKIYFYPLQNHDPLEKLPRISPTGDGAKPGAGALQELLNKLGSTSPARKIIVVSKPVHPDNNRQTIYQPATPPDLRITMDLKLPNIVGGASTPVAKPQVHFNPSDSKPLLTKRSLAKAMAPTLAATNTVVPTSLPDGTVKTPHLAVPLNESRPNQNQMIIGEVAAPSLAASNVTAGTNLGEAYKSGSPAAPAAPASDAAEGSANGKTSKSTAVQTAGDGSGIVVIGVDPAEAAALASLPPGNRWGDFTIAPGGGQPGAAGGDPHWTPNAGSGNGGVGGDHSTGVGSGITGGGGGKSGSPGVLSITGSGGKGDSLLDPMIIRDMVFPVPSTMVLRKNALVVSAGPMGGGGLDVYGALRCGKIYTVFIAMPGKSWTLQYCQSGHAAAPAAAQNSSVVRMEQGLVPPDAETRFDFKRLPVPFEKKNKPIVLKGVIKEDGTIGDLKVYQGIVTEMDEAARVAFSKFKFKPAMKEGKPVVVDMLVGIPTELPAATRAQ